MATTHGKSAVFKVQDSGGTLRDLSQYLSKDGLSLEADPPEATTKGSNAKKYAPGLTDGSISVEGPWDTTVDGYLAGILNMERSFEYHPAGTGAGTPKYSGSVILKSYELEAPADELVTFSAEFQVTGGVTRGTNP